MYDKFIARRWHWHRSTRVKNDARLRRSNFKIKFSYFHRGNNISRKRIWFGKVAQHLVKIKWKYLNQDMPKLVRQLKFTSQSEKSKSKYWKHVPKWDLLRYENRSKGWLDSSSRHWGNRFATKLTIS